MSLRWHHRNRLRLCGGVLIGVDTMSKARQMNDRRRMTLIVFLATATLWSTGCAALRSRGNQQGSCGDMTCREKACADVACMAPGTLKPVDVADYPVNGCGAPVGCQPLIGPSATVPPETPYFETEQMEVVDSVESMLPTPDTISNRSGGVSPLPIPPYPQSGMALRNTGPAPAAGCGPCQECLTLRDDTTELQQHVAQLQQSLETEREVRSSLEESLSVIRHHVTRISDDVRYWQGEVRRIDEEAELQHKDDLKSLQMLSELVAQLPTPVTVSDVDLSLEEE